MCRVIVSVRIAYPAWPEQGLVLPRNRPLFPLLDIVQVFLGLSIPLGMSGEGAWETSFPTLRVRPAGLRATVSAGVMLNRRVRSTVDVAVDVALTTAVREFVVDTHDQNRPLHGRCQKVNDPCAPTCHSQPGVEAGCEKVPAGRLNAHHGNAQTADVFQVVRCPDLWHILDSGKDGCHDSEEVGPVIELLGQGEIKDAGEDDDYQAMKYAKTTHSGSGAPVWSSSTQLILRNIRLSIAKEDQEENETGKVSAGSCVNWHGETNMRVKQSH